MGILESISRKAEVVGADKRWKVKVKKERRRRKKKKMRDGEAIGKTIGNGGISNIVETMIIGRRELRNNHIVTNFLTVTPRVTDGPVLNRDRVATEGIE